MPFYKNHQIKIQLFCVLLIAILMRVLWIHWLSINGSYLLWATKYQFSESLMYYNYSVSILNQGIYSTDFYSPGYALILAFFQLIGFHGIDGVRFAQTLLDSTAIFPIFLILTRSLSIKPKLGMMCALTYALCPIWAAASTQISAEFLSPVLISWAIFFLLEVIKRKSIILWLLLGVYIAIMALIRMDFLLFIIPALFCCIWSQWQNKIYLCGSLVGLLFCFLVIIASWGFYTKTHFGNWVFVSTNSGICLWEGLGDIDNSYGFKHGDQYPEQVLAENHIQYGSYEGNRFLKQQYLQMWKKDPVFVLKTIGIRWVRMLFLYDYAPIKPISQQKSKAFYYAKMGARIFCIIGTTIWLICLALLAYRKEFSRVAIVALPMAYALCSTGLTFYLPKYIEYAYLSYLFALFMLLELAFYCKSSLKNRINISTT